MSWTTIVLPLLGGMILWVLFDIRGVLDRIAAQLEKTPEEKALEEKELADAKFEEEYANTWPRDASDLK